MTTSHSDISPLAYPAEAILTTAQVAEWIQVAPGTAKEWPLPRLNMPGSTVRFSAGMVLAFLEGRLDQYLKRAV